MTNETLEGARIFCGPLDEIHNTIKKHNIGWLVSAINGEKMPQTPVAIDQDHHLKLAMNDISSDQDGLILPSQVHVQRLIDFIHGWDQASPLMIHCWAGVSRSTAATFISLCCLNEGTSEKDIAFLLRQASPTATPNIRLVSLADDLLGRAGRMVEAIDLIGQGEMTFEGNVFSLSSKM